MTTKLICRDTGENPFAAAEWPSFLWPLADVLPELILCAGLDHYRKDVRLPVQLQRAMAAEAEAAREARAKVSPIKLEKLHA